MKGKAETWWEEAEQSLRVALLDRLFQFGAGFKYSVKVWKDLPLDLQESIKRELRKWGL